MRLCCALGFEVLLLTRHQTARNSCPRLSHSVDSRFGLYIKCRCRVKFSTQYQPCIELLMFIFKLIRSFSDPAYTCSIFVRGPLQFIVHYYKVPSLHSELDQVLCTTALFNRTESTTLNTISW